LYYFISATGKSSIKKLESTTPPKTTSTTAESDVVPLKEFASGLKKKNKQSQSLLF